MKLKSIVAAAFAIGFGAAISAGAAVAQTGNASGPLVNGDWLEKNLSNPKVRIVEVSVDPGVFERGHIPGAQNVVWHTDLVDTVRRDIASPEKFQALVRKLGVDQDTTVVLYGDSNNWFAAWGAWVFDIYGVEQREAARWRPQEVGSRQAPARHPRGVAASRQPHHRRAANPKLRARLADVRDGVEKQDRCPLVDIRSADEFSGKIIAPAGSRNWRCVPATSRAPLNVPWARGHRGRHPQVAGGAEEALRRCGHRRLQADHHLLPDRRAFEPHLVHPVEDARLRRRNYDGSWTEYGNTVGLPVINLAGTVWGGK